MKKWQYAAVTGITIAYIFILFIFSQVMPSRAVPSYLEKNKKQVIIIDAGHGGVDGGAVSASGIVEKEINLKIALKLEKMLKMSGFEVILTRDSDKSIHDDSAKTIRSQKTSDLHNRLKIADEHPEALFISIHQNKFGSSKYTGLQCFYSSKDLNSKVLAQCIQDFTRENIQQDNDRMIKKVTKDVYIIYHAKQPAVLVECGFLSNRGEAELLNTDDYQSKLAFAILGGILEFYR